MKKLIPVLIAIFAFVACEKDPDTDKLDNGYLVLTDYQKSTTFNSFSTFFIPDSILAITGSKADTTYLTDANAKSVINAFKTNMTNRGYTYTSKKGTADLGIQLSYIEDTYYLTTWGDPWRYSGYWWPGYWNGAWNNYNWYYPYAVTYSYNTGSLIADMINLDATPTSNKLPIIWNTYISGLIAPNGGLNTTKTVASVNQAFTQSPYLKK